MAYQQDIKSAYVDPNQTQQTAAAKLFVGQVPPSTSETQLRQLFEPFGQISDLVILKDNRTQLHKGCAFVTFALRDSADKAILSLDGKHQLPSAKKPLAVRYAGQKPPEEDKAQEYKLYIGMLSRLSTDDDVRKIFEPYGVVKEVFLIKQADGKSKGSAFVKYMRREDAERAIKALDGRYRDKEAPGALQIRFAHTKQEKALLQQTQAPAGGLAGLGGMGLAGLGGAASLNSIYGFGNSMSGLANPFSQTINPIQSSHMQPGQFASNPASYMAQPFNSLAGGLGGASLPGRVGDVVKGPSGCNLFIYNLPLAFSDTDLAALFSNFGTVLSSHIQRDRLSGASKGFGFVSFDNPQSANAAIASLDNFVLSGRKISVRLKKETGGAGKPY